jgi:single-strand DNA-binding protein
MASGRLDVREYEGRDGVKRTSVDIVADEVAATLRWATVSIEKTPSRGEGGASARPSRGPAPAADEAFYGDEEPF